jgi:outer membrane protein assembly factor BamA
LPGEYLIKKNEINVEGQRLSAAEKTRLLELADTRIPLKPNSNFGLFFPKERSTLRYRFEADTPKFTALMMRLDGEVPALVDSNRIDVITNNLKNTLQSEGYFDAEASYTIKYFKKKARITYTLTPKRIYRLDSFNTLGVDSFFQDTLLMQEIKSISSNSLLRKSVPVSASLRDNEAKRVSNALRDKGYFDFTPSQFSRFVAYDTTNHKVDLNLFIYSPDNDSVFHKYTIGDIYVYPAYTSGIPREQYQDTLIGSYHFRTNNGRLIMNPKYVTAKIAIEPGDIYSYRDYRKTLLQLNTLDIFKTPRIIVQKRDDSSTILDYHIQLSKEKKYEDELGFENFVSSIAQQQLLFGVSLHAGLKIKNVFKGSETFELNLDGSTETSFSGAGNGNITTLGMGMSMVTPRYRDWLTLGALQMISGLISNEFMSDLKTLGEQRINLGFSYEDNRSFYEATSIKFSRGVRLSRGNHNFNFVFQEVDLLSPQKGPDFDTFVGSNEVYARSFQPQMITGFLFRSMTYGYTSPIKNKKSYKFLFGFEQSGLEISGINGLTGNQNNSFRFNGDDFNFSRFIKAEIEPKFTYHLNKKSELAFRLGVGLALPYGKVLDEDGTRRVRSSIPYSELFSLGGSYSLRAWRNREIGPGGDNNTITASGDRVPTPFAADQFKAELSAEYRFDLGWIIEGALFAETGNVWSLSKEATSQQRPSLETLAVDAGVGVRFDLTFFLFRFDVAFPMRNWYPDSVDGTHWNTSSLRDLTKGTRAAIGINYPF